MARGNKVIAMICVGLLGTVLSACGASSTKPSATQSSGKGTTKTQTTLTIAEPVLIAAHAPLYVAIQNGYFASRGIKVQFSTLNTASTLDEALKSGSIQLAGGASFNVITADAKSLGFQAIVDMGGVTLQLCMSSTFAKQQQLTSASSAATVLAKLKGQTIGLTGFGSPPQFVLNYMLSHYGHLNPSTDVKESAVGSVPAEVTALQRGEIQGFFQSPPTCNQAVAGGFGAPLLTASSLSGLTNVPYALLYGAKQWLASHPSLARSVAQAVAEGDAYVKTHPAGAAAVLHADYFPTVPTSALTATLKSLVAPTIPTAGLMTETGWRSANAVMTVGASLPTPPSPVEGGMWTNKYLSGS